MKVESEEMLRGRSNSEEILMVRQPAIHTHMRAHTHAAAHTHTRSVKWGVYSYLTVFLFQEFLDAKVKPLWPKGWMQKRYTCNDSIYTHVHVIVVSWFYSVWDMYHARLYVLSRVDPKEVHTARGRCYPMHCKNHETADLYR